ncbi:MAG: long-chain-fatty-acid--CoA ligase [Gaiellaceae bacterium MAG52_C11]|nr:long-chain-fatty-acid--CoA ligase [Candidatus Gaiellasilicea maunaloa]
MAIAFAHLYDLVGRWAAETPERTALEFGESRWTWRELDERSRRSAGALRAAGVQPGDRVAFLEKNHPACLETTFAATLCGAVNAVVNFRLSPSEIADVIDDSRATVLFVGAELVDGLEQVRDRLETVERVVIVGGDADEYESWLARAEPIEAAVLGDPDDCCLQLYTSGTTGLPKGAMLTHRGIAAHTTAVAEEFSMTAESVSVVAMPLFHVGGICYAFVSLLAGARTLLVREPIPDAIFDLAEREQATHGFFVPALFAAFMQTPERAREALSGMECLVYGASPMPLPLLERCLELLPVDFHQVYGMTEMAGVISALGPEEHRNAERRDLLVSAGRPIRDAEVKVVDAVTLEDVPLGEVGELWIRSPQVMAGYWDKPDATAQVLELDGWYRTGDVGIVDGDGYLFIQDRVKDMIISGGENIYAAEVERAAIEHPAVADVAVIGIPDDRWGEAVKAVVVPAEGAEVDADELIAFCRARLAHYKCPTSVDLVEMLPRNMTGKVLKRELRDPYWAGRERPI